MISTYGLTHIALPVKDVRRTAAFYEKVFGCCIMYDHGNFIQVQTPGSRDIIVFEQSPIPSDLQNVHYGFRLMKQEDPEQLAETILSAGGTIKEKGHFASGEPYIFFYDPDGYMVEVFYENIPGTLKDFN
ncbi:MAG: VOC family protein [Chitinophagaceae bacterium]|nr:VOC family protein [Chitinophagaceae bacterium]